MVLVRRSELACRNGWDQDLWEPPEQRASTPASEAPVAPDRVRDGGGGPRDGARHERPDPRETITATSFLPGRSQPAPPRRAVPAVQPEPRLSPETEASPTRRAEFSRPARAPRRPLDPPSAGEAGGTGLARSDPSPVAPAAEDARLRRSNRLTTVSRRSVPLRVGGVAAWAAPDLHDPLEDSLVTRRPLTPRPGIPAAPSPQERPAEGARSHDAGRPADPGSYPGSWVQSRSGSTEPFPLVPSAAPRSAPAPEASGAAASPGIPVRETGVEEEEGDAPVSVSLMDTPAGTLPRCCRTCRDFRPAGAGDRGWCHNRYAFEHPQMVDANALACESTIGTWWVPADDWWLQKADIAHHGRPTPIVDEYLHRLLEERTSGRKREAR